VKKWFCAIVLGATLCVMGLLPNEAQAQRWRRGGWGRRAYYGYRYPGYYGYRGYGYRGYYGSYYRPWGYSYGYRYPYYGYSTPYYGYSSYGYGYGYPYYGSGVSVTVGTPGYYWGW
jgi:hypothetical protein